MPRRTEMNPTVAPAVTAFEKAALAGTHGIYEPTELKMVLQEMRSDPYAYADTLAPYGLLPEDQGIAARAADEQPAPLIHLNGSGAANLYRQARAVVKALEEAITALVDAAPHLRDYYPMEDGGAGYRDARLIHEARLAALRTLQDRYLANAHEAYEHAGPTALRR